MGLLKFLFSKTFLKQLVFAMIVFLGIFYLFTRWLDTTTHHNEFIEVPNLLKKDTVIAEKMLEEKGLTLGDIEYKEYNPKFPKGGIVEQSPKPGDQVKEGRKIYVSVNKKEYRKIEVPVLNNQTKRQAISTLSAIGFQVGEEIYKPHFAKDAVIGLQFRGKKLKQGDKLPYTSVIDLVLGDGKLSYGEQPKTDEGTTDEGAN